jgi:hypothetical protein
MERTRACVQPYHLLFIGANRPLTNADIVRMAKAKFDDATIVKASPVNAPPAKPTIPSLC